MNEANFYSNLPKLETERLILRKYTLEDVDDYYSFASDSEVTRFLRWGPHPNKDYTLAYIEGVIDGYLAGKDSPWGIEHKESKKLIGIIHLMQLDNFHKKAQIGLVLARDYWNMGYAAEALNEVLEYCFSSLSLNRVEALCITDNIAAIKLLKSLGMENEGLLRDYLYQKECFRSFFMFSILRSDFEARRNYQGRVL